MNAASPPEDLISFAVPSPADSVTSAITTFAPSAANSFAAMRPIPLAAPVMRATLSFKRMPETSLHHPDLGGSSLHLVRLALREKQPGAKTSAGSLKIDRDPCFHPRRWQPSAPGRQRAQSFL